MRWIALSLIVFVAAGLSLAQTKASNPQPSYEGQRVGSVELSINPRTDTEKYRSLLVQKAGESFSGEKIKASVDALQASGSFTKVEVKLEPDPAGLKVTFVLEPSYYVGILSFPGALRVFPYARLLQV